MLITEKIEKLLLPVAGDYDMNIVQVSFSHQTLSILVEKRDFSSPTIDECELASKAFSAVLDVEDVIADRYMLEVSSCGMDRPLVKLEDYSRFVGRDVKLELKMPRNADDNRRHLKGKIVDVKGEEIFLQTLLDKQIQTISFMFDNVSKCKLLVTDEMIKQILKDKKNERKK